MQSKRPSDSNCHCRIQGQRCFLIRTRNINNKGLMWSRVMKTLDLLLFRKHSAEAATGTAEPAQPKRCRSSESECTCDSSTDTSVSIFLCQGYLRGLHQISVSLFSLPWKHAGQERPFCADHETEHFLLLCSSSWSVPSEPALSSSSFAWHMDY